MILSRRAVPTLVRWNFQNSNYPLLVGLYKSNPVQNMVSSQRSSQSKPEEECNNVKPQNLLRFPAFPLKQTMEKFMKTAMPLLTEAELIETKTAAQQFLTKEGKRLQDLLENAAEMEQNWLASRWQRVAYFQYRDPVTVFSSPGMTFPIRKFNSQDDYVEYTSKLIYAMLRYKELIDDNKIPIAKMGKFELDNSQFKQVFGTCRIPKINEDTIEYNPDSKYIIVMHKNNFYKFPVYNKQNEILSPNVFNKELKKIINQGSDRAIPFGLLTTDHRDNWAKAYAELVCSFETERIVKEIQRSLFNVSLDEHANCEHGSELNTQALQLIHGGGSRLNAGNRWMDKTIQLCVNPNGGSGFTYEHSPAEGQPIAMIVDYVLDNLKCDSFFENGACTDYESPKLLKLKISPCIDDYIMKAKVNVDKLADDLEMNVLVYEGYGKEFLKQQKLSPDSFIQIALQYAFYALHGVPGAAYESAHLRIYNGGRTETIRSCSTEAIEFAKAMCSGGSDDKEDLLRKAVDVHRKYTMDALMGQGVDRHLLGLKLMAIENNLPVPKFYKSPGVIKSSHFRLSTSQVATKYKAFMCYGPLVDDGYGCCYNPRDSSMIFALSSWRKNSETCSNRFARALTEALDMMKITLESSNKCSKL